MKYHLATDEQLKCIFNHEKDCPTHILSGVVEEMMNRNMLNGYILYAAESVNIKSIDDEDLLQIGLIEIHKRINKFNPGKTTPKTFAINILRNKFMNLIKDQQLYKSAANYNKVIGESLDDYLIQSPFNVERYVICKLELEQCLSFLKEHERVAMIMKNNGYKLNEIANQIGFNSDTSVAKLIRKAKRKIREELGYENQILNKQIS
ncbi:sigma-70 family RNA polymerase sigma factor [Ornithinibacillus xuwenensis]|uniref:Sigma-70 family RNA polymerase sigma factor n=1 Tax=Ornithinibacillus xuwenensis TaxID=3144668 RepID=A0ABU9XBX3_9BACI